MHSFLERTQKQHPLSAILDFMSVKIVDGTPGGMNKELF